MLYLAKCSNNGKETKMIFILYMFFGGIVNVGTKPKRRKFVDTAEFIISYVGSWEGESSVTFSNLRFLTERRYFALYVHDNLVAQICERHMDCRSSITQRNSNFFSLQRPFWLRDRDRYLVHWVLRQYFWVLNTLKSVMLATDL
jgi:hypothetical protein